MCHWGPQPWLLILRGEERILLPVASYQIPGEIPGISREGPPQPTRGPSATFPPLIQKAGRQRVRVSRGENSCLGGRPCGFLSWLSPWCRPGGQGHCSYFALGFVICMIRWWASPASPKLGSVQAVPLFKYIRTQGIKVSYNVNTQVSLTFIARGLKTSLKYEK